MPRKPGSGGARQGQPGKSYPNRTDMQQNRAPAQPIRTVPAKTYGDATAQRQAQQAIPLPQATPLTAPTARPNEPLTAGMPRGPGPGAEAVTPPIGLSADENLEATIRGMYQKFPNSDLERLVAELSARRQTRP